MGKTSRKLGHVKVNGTGLLATLIVFFALITAIFGCLCGFGFLSIFFVFVFFLMMIAIFILLLALFSYFFDCRTLC